MPEMKSAIIPTLRYPDAHKAIDFLCNVFGLERVAVYEDESGQVAHAELVYGGGMIMLGSAGTHGPFDQWVRPPANIEAANTAGVYVIVEDCKAHFERAKKGGAIILMPFEEKDYGGAGYTCRDPWGFVWSFGSFNPWAPEEPAGKR